MTRTNFVVRWMAATCVAAASFCAFAAAERGVDAKSGATVPATPAPAVATRTRRLVYSCREGNVPMFSDRPCGEASLLRSLEVYTPAQSGRPPSTEPERPKSSTKPAQREALAKSLQETAEKCERLGNAVEAIDDRMRAGYPAREAGRLWQRWRDAKEALRAAGC